MKKVSPFLLAALTLALSGCVDDTTVTTDYCPDDDKKINPGVCGCGTPDVDTDGDGTLDCLEECFEDANKTEPGTCGCGIADDDLDGNKVPDCLEGDMDLCPEDPDKTLPGICGCGTPDVDENGNTVPDCLEENMDLCPEDPDKTLPGICGCGAVDEDKDGDGAYACHEACDNDPEKTSEGACGCGIPDVDTDGDGTLDCLEACPIDPSKTEAGICGCGHADEGANVADDDGDGTVNCLDLCPNNPLKTDPGQGDCAWQDTDGDLVEDKDDGCIYNPTITEAGKDCNYVKDTDGSDVFEIWTAADLKRLKEELDKRIPEDRIGFSFTNDMTCYSTCVEPGKSSLYKYFNCLNLYGDIYVREDLYGTDYCYGAICTYQNNMMSCLPTSGKCNQVDEPSQNNDCCNYDTWNEMYPSGYHCAANGAILYCDGIRLYEESCYSDYCRESEDGATCDICHGEVVSTGGELHQCCDDEYVNSCSADGTTLYSCMGGRVEHSMCANGCNAESGECVTACTGEPVTTGGTPGSCCDPIEYQKTCDGTGIWECSAGLVKYTECADTCMTQTSEVDGETVTKSLCRYTVSTPIESLFKVRLMRDIDLNEGYQIERYENACVIDFTSLDLYRTQFDGNGHTIRLTSDEERCAITKPIFDNVIESHVNDLKLDLDLRGKPEAAMSRYIKGSVVKNIEWNGHLIGNMSSIFGNQNTSTSIIASFAQDSVIEGIVQKGTVQTRNTQYYGIIGYVDNTSVRDVDIQLSELNSMTLSTIGFYQINNSSEIDNINVNIDNFTNYNNTHYGIFYSLNINSQINHLDISMKNIDNLSTSALNLLGQINSGKLSNVTLNIDKITSQGIVYGGIYQNAANGIAKDLNIAIKDLKANNSIHGFGYHNYGTIKNLKFNSDKIESLDSEFYGLVYQNQSSATAEDLDINIKEIKARNNIHGFGYYNYGTIKNLKFNSDKIESLDRHFYGLIYQNQSGATTEDLDINIKEIKARNNIHGFGYYNYGTIKNLKFNSDKIESLDSHFYGLVYQNQSSATAEDLDINIKEIKARNNIRGFGYYNYGTIRNLKFNSDKIESLDGQFNGLVYRNQSSATAEKVDITLNDIKAHTVYGLTEYLNTNSILTDIKLNINNIVSNRYYTFSSIYGQLQNIKINIGNVYSDAIHYISSSARETSINNMTVYFNKLHINDLSSYRYNVFGISNPWNGTRISNLAVYGNIYMPMPKGEDHNGEAYKNNAPLFNFDDTTSSYHSNYQNIASSIRVQQYETYDENTDSYTGLTPYEGALCFDRLTSTYHTVDNFYYMTRDGLQNPAFNTNDGSGIFTPFTKEEINDVVTSLNTYAGEDIWETKDVVENGETIQIPWLKATP